MFLICLYIPFENIFFVKSAVNIKSKHNEIKDIGCLMQEGRKWHL